MIKLSNIKLPVDYTDNIVVEEISKAIRIPKNAIIKYEFAKRSVDARKKNNVHYIATINVAINEKIIKENDIIKKNKKLNLTKVTPYEYIVKAVSKQSLPPVVVGMGPAGLCCGLVLAQAGACPIVIERGKAVEERQKDVNAFWNTGVLNTSSNVQFGEGGAGTFSDGKLNTGTKDTRAQKVRQEFVKHGAPREILYSAKPHIGTDKLPEAVKNIRNEIIRLGGRVLFETQLTDIIIKNNPFWGLFF